MTATLNAAPCSEVRVHMPRYGYWTAYATLSTTSAPALPTTAGGVTLVVAGLTMIGTVVRQGAPGETRTVEFVGGYGGWRRGVRPLGFRADNLVSLAAYVADLALAAGERAELAAGVDRKLGPIAVRLGESDAGALLSQACSLPAGSAVVPWWVDLDGTTRLGARSGAAVAARAIDSDPLGRRYHYALEDAAPLLPGATIDGATIEELRIEASGDSVHEIATVAPTDEEPRTFAAGLRRLILSIVGPFVSATRIYRYVVKEVLVDGRIRAVPVRALLAPDLPALRVWPGLAGGRCVPAAGSEILVQFADGDPIADAACVVGFAPAVIGSAGIPTRTELDGAQVVLARGTLPTGRGGATLRAQPIGASVGTPLVLTLTDPDGGTHVWSICGTTAGGPVVFTVVPGTGVSLTGLATIDEGRTEVLV